MIKLVLMNVVWIHGGFILLFYVSCIVVVQIAVVSVDVKILFFIFIDACRFWKDYQCFRFFFFGCRDGKT